MSKCRANWSKTNGNKNFEVVYQNNWFSIVNRNSFYSLEYSVPQVVVLPIIGSRILMVKVYRPLIDDTPWELPAGGNIEGESSVETARRELNEETGIYIEDTSRFNNKYMLSELPGRSTELLTVYTVNITEKEFHSRESFDATEIQNLRLFSLIEIKRAIVVGDIYLSSPVAIISRYIFENNL